MALHQGFYGVLVPAGALAVASYWNATAAQVLRGLLLWWFVQYAFFFTRPYDKSPRRMGHTGWGDDSIFAKYMMKNIPTRVLLQNPDIATNVPAQYIMALHPHGVWSVGHLHVAQGSLGMNQIFDPRTRRSLSAKALFLIPGVRELWLWNNFVDASRHVAEKCLQEGYSLCVLPGGEREQLLSQIGKEMVVLKNRKGFVRLALQRDIPLIPIYVFGENDLSENPSWFFGFRSWVQRKFAIALMFAHSFDTFTFCGRRWRVPRPSRAYYDGRPLIIAYGKPIYPPGARTISSPSTTASEADGSELKFKWRNASSITDTEVNEFHKLYMDSLERLFNEMKGIAGFPDRQLEII